MLFTLTVTDAEPVMPVTWVTAVIVACVLAVTWGATNSPVDEMVPMVLLQLTALVLVPFAEALHWLVCRGCITVGVHVTVIAVTGATVTVVLPLFVASWTEPALMVTVVLVVTTGAVNIPLASMLPEVDPQVTPVLKLPVPVTVAAQLLVWPDSMVVGVHDTVTAVMVEVVELLPPPQAPIPIKTNEDNIRAKTRKLIPQTVRAQHSLLQMNILM